MALVSHHHMIQSILAANQEHVLFLWAGPRRHPPHLQTSTHVGIAIVKHPPFITIVMGGINHQTWVVYDTAIPTLYSNTIHYP